MRAKDASRPVTVVVADSSRLNAELLAAHLSRSHYGLRVAACATTSKEVLEKVRRQELDIALISAQLTDGPLAGFSALRELRLARPKTRVVMLLESDERELVIDAFRGGACGILCRSDSMERLGKCLFAVSQGQIWASSAEVQYLLEALARAAPLRSILQRRTAMLSPREQDVVRLVAEGLTNREISHQLRLSEHTIKNYVFRVYDKLGVSNRVELALFSISPDETLPLPPRRS